MEQRCQGLYRQRNMLGVVREELMEDGADLTGLEEAKLQPACDVRT